MQFKTYLKKLLLKEQSGTTEKGIKSADVMPLVSSAELTNSQGDGKLGEDFDLDDDAKVTISKELQNQTPNKGTTVKGDLSKVIGELAKKQKQTDTHVSNGKAITVIKVPAGPNAPDYIPVFPDNPQSELEQKIAETEEHLDQTNSRGLGIGGNRSNNHQLYKTKTNWRALLRNTATKIEDIKRTYTKINKRMFAANLQLPGKVKDESGVDIIFALDTSGSISDKTLSIFISEIFKVAREFEGESTMRILLWHTNVYLDCIVSAEYSPQQIVSAVQKLPTVSGGTTLSCIRDYFVAEKIEINIPEALYLIVLTDGYVEDSPKMPKDVLKENIIFLVIEGGSLASVKPVGGKSLFIDVYR